MKIEGKEGRFQLNEKSLEEAMGFVQKNSADNPKQTRILKEYFKGKLILEKKYQAGTGGAIKLY